MRSGPAQSDRSCQPYLTTENLTDETVWALRADQLADDRLDLVALTDSLRGLACAATGVPHIECSDFAAESERELAQARRKCRFSFSVITGRAVEFLRIAGRVRHELQREIVKTELPG